MNNSGVETTKNELEEKEMRWVGEMVEGYIDSALGYRSGCWALRLTDHGHDTMAAGCRC